VAFHLTKPIITINTTTRIAALENEAPPARGAFPGNCLEELMTGRLSAGALAEDAA